MMARVKVALLGFGLVGLAVAYVAFRPRPTLAGINLLIGKGRFDEAEARYQAYLDVYPNDDAANLMLAQLAVQRPDAKPELALAHIRRVRGRNPMLVAHVKVVEGKADYFLRRLVASEAAFREALRLAPQVPEAGWGLLNLYSLQSRADETRQICLTLERREPDRHDKVQFLLQMLRYDAHRMAAGSVVFELEKAVVADPNDLYSTLALGLALIREGSRAELGIEYLNRAVRSHPGNPAVWLAYLSGLAEAGEVRELGSALGRLPPELAGDHRFDEVRGRDAFERRDWPAAIADYRRAWEDQPYSKEVLYRLIQSLSRGGQDSEANRLRPRLVEIDQARERMRALYDRATKITSLGTVPDLDLYHDLADVMERLGRSDEARAWHMLILEDNPDDRISRLALERLGKPQPEHAS
jgi:tetratricopeptide (TPR) repeat protein